MILPTNSTWFAVVVVVVFVAACTGQPVGANAAADTEPDAVAAPETLDAGPQDSADAGALPQQDIEIASDTAQWPDVDTANDTDALDGAPEPDLVPATDSQVAELADENATDALDTVAEIAVADLVDAPDDAQTADGPVDAQADVGPEVDGDQADFVAPASDVTADSSNANLPCAVVGCDDGNPCNVDTCDKTIGCQHTYPAACPDGCLTIATAVGNACAADAPWWGLRPDDPAGLFKANADGTASDSQTALQWQLSDPGAKTWPFALTYCQTLNLGGHIDWRLPTVAELFTIRNLSKVNPAISSVFVGTSSVGYWTVVPLASSGTGAWLVFFFDGFSNGNDVSNNNHVRCVR